MICWTFSSLDTEFRRIKESVVWTLGYTSILDIGQCLVDEIILRTCGSANSVSIQSKLSKGTVFETFF